MSKKLMQMKPIKHCTESLHALLIEVLNSDASQAGKDLEIEGIQAYIEDESLVNKKSEDSGSLENIFNYEDVHRQKQDYHKQGERVLV
jgi:hypothetical protein